VPGASNASELRVECGSTKGSSKLSGVVLPGGDQVTDEPGQLAMAARSLGLRDRVLHRDPVHGSQAGRRNDALPGHGDRSDVPGLAPPSRSSSTITGLSWSGAGDRIRTDEPAAYKAILRDRHGTLYIAWHAI